MRTDHRLMSTSNQIYTFLVELLETEPSIWRQFQVPSTYSFWDLHVAVQDAMGWLDCHLHSFQFEIEGEVILIGIPDDEGFSDLAFLPGWETPLTEYFVAGRSCLYEYDFGDSWLHEVTLTSIEEPTTNTSYPRCLGGEIACPPEDCGGVPGYYHILDVMRDPSHEEYDYLVGWLGRRYLPTVFELDAVIFDDPRKRFVKAFTSGA